MSKKIILLAGRASMGLAMKMATRLKAEAKRNFVFVKIEIQIFADKEFRPQILKSIRGADVYVVQSINQPTDNLFELILIGDAAKRASAASITAVIPYCGFARQDRKDKPRVPITAKVVASMLQNEGYFNRVITMDLHADQIQGFFDIPVDHLYASALFVPDIISLNLKKAVMASPDTGGTKKAGKYAEFLETEMVFFYKSRKKPNEIKEMRLVGDVKGKDVVLIDDIYDTGGTIIKAANLAMTSGANSVRAYCSFPVCSNGSYEKIEDSGLTEIVFTDAIPLDFKSPKIRILSIEKLFADAISIISRNQSVSSLFHVM